MRRDFRKNNNDKIIIYSAVGVLVLLAIVFALLMYGNSLDTKSKGGKFGSNEFASMTEDDKDNTDVEETSGNMGKSVEEAENTLSEENGENKDKTKTDEKVAEKDIDVNKNSSKSETTINAAKSSVNNTATPSKTVTSIVNKDTKAKKEENKKELSFQRPVEGETMRGFAKDNLIYSETLKEWVTHNGIDIKAEKTTVVKASEDGKVKSIKNDPRYGLTIVIEHQDGFETIYANLLSSEFVVEGENVKKGQSIGTVGNTASFESLDEPHLHFEVVKDSVQVDPSIYLK